MEILSYTNTEGTAACGASPGPSGLVSSVWSRAPAGGTQHSLSVGSSGSLVWLHTVWGNSAGGWRNTCHLCLTRSLQPFEVISKRLSDKRLCFGLFQILLCASWIPGSPRLPFLALPGVCECTVRACCSPWVPAYQRLLSCQPRILQDTSI